MWDITNNMCYHFAVIRLYDILYTEGKTVAMNTRLLRPDEDELLEHTKDFVVLPVLVPTEPQVPNEEEPEATASGQAATEGASGSRTESPADQSKKRPAEGSSGGKAKRTKKGRINAALKSKLLSPSAQPAADLSAPPIADQGEIPEDSPDVMIVEPPTGKVCIYDFPCRAYN
jgi:pyruvate/2-oxoglutarate dehydrogenase complex dihydrolipoamide acyltransferase (E2) component